jgi:hypothetical protein
VRSQKCEQEMILPPGSVCLYAQHCAVVKQCHSLTYTVTMEQWKICAESQGRCECVSFIFAGQSMCGIFCIDTAGISESCNTEVWPDLDLSNSE